MLSCFLVGSDEEREYYHKALLDSSYEIAHADTKAKQHNVFAYVDSILSAIHSVFFSQIPKGDL